MEKDDRPSRMAVGDVILLCVEVLKMGTCTQNNDPDAETGQIKG
jgi:hypothetical protein